MLLLLLTICVAVTSAQLNVTLDPILDATETVPKMACTSCYKIDGTCYNATHLFDLQAPFRNHVVITQLAVLKATNELFYAFEPEINDKEYYKVGFVNLDDPNMNGVISSEQASLNFECFDIDQNSKKIYLGGSDGISVLDRLSNKLQPYSSRGDTILSLVFKGIVYFVRYAENKITKKEGDRFFALLDYDSVKKFVITDKFEYVFLSSYGLYVSRNRETVVLSKNAYFRGLSIDQYGVVYAWWIDKIYKIIIEAVLNQSRLVEIGEIDSIGALAFDKDNNYIFTSGKGLYTLTEISNDTDCCCLPFNTY